MNFDDVVDELYGLLPAEFTAARDARAAEARSAGDRDTATVIKRLRRPTAGAYLANLLVRERREDLGALVELGSAMRQAQGAGEGGELRRLGQERRQSIARLAKEGGRLAAAHGQDAGPAALRELEDTLEAAVADTEAAGAVLSGRLTTALRFSGFGAVDLSGAVAAPPSAAPPSAAPPSAAPPSAAPPSAGTPAAGTPKRRGTAAARGSPAPASGPQHAKTPALKAPTGQPAATTSRRSRQLEATAQAVREAEEALRQATDESERAGKRLAVARGQEEARRAERRELEHRLGQLRQAEEAADRELRESKAAAATADRARRAARARLERAEAAHERLGP